MSLRYFLFFLVVPLAALPAAAALRSGKVVDRNGDAVPHSSVIVRETLEGARTDEEGNFSLELPESGSVTLVITAPGKPAIVRPMELREGEPLVLALDLMAAPQVNMEAVTVTSAGPPPPPLTRSSILTPLDVVTLPGANAGINRALQTLPGVQNVDEGDALFVRGGDYWETGAFINGSLFPSAVRLEAPTGTFVGTVNAFLTKKISFAAGGFGARYGNLLSGVVAVDTQDAPSFHEGTFNVGLGALSVGGGLPLNESSGIRFAATRYDLKVAMKLNGSNVHFEPAPKGSDVSASAVWAYRPGAQLKLFAIQQNNQFGVQVDEPSYQGFYSQQQRSRFTVLSVNDSFAGVAVEGSVSTGQAHTVENFGDLGIDTRLPSSRAWVQATYSGFNDVSFSAGAEEELTGLRMTGSKPSSSDALAPGSPRTDVSSRADGQRNGLFVEGDWIATQRLHLITGIRTDQSSLTGQRTVDPRWSLTYKLVEGLLLTGSGGIYHQVPDILFYNPWLGGGNLPAMRAIHRIVGLQWGEGNRQLRIEAYRKTYAGLDQFTRDRFVSRNGMGRSEGIDLFAKYPLPYAVTARVTVSLLDAERTDPDTGLASRAAFGIRNSTTVILMRNFSGGYQTGVSWRAATGKPFTEVSGASFDPTRGVFVPIYAAPYAGRLPAYQRFDFNLSKFKQQTPKVLTVWYLSLSNVLGDKNVSGYTYSADFRERQAKPSLFNRSVYVGISFIYR